MNYDLSTIQTAFLPELKFMADNYTSQLDAELVGQSLSGKYYNSGVNPIITLRNVLSFMPLTTEWVVATYSAAVTYSIGDLVLSGGVYYVSLQNTNFNHAVNLTAWWRSTTLQSVWIKNKLYGIFETVLSKSILANKLFDHAKLYNNADDSDLITNTSKFVGFEIRPRSSQHLRIILNRISTQFSTGETVTIYLYKQNTLVSSFDVTNTAKELTFTDITDLTISGESRWFLFYDQDQLTGQAYNSVIGSSQYVNILPFEVPNTTTDFINAVNTFGSNSYGLGLDFSVYADLTPFIVSNKQMFAECIQMEWQYEILQMFLSNPDVMINSSQRNIDKQTIRELLLIELRGDTKHSLASQMERAYKTLVRSLNFNEAALPGENENYITFNSFG